MKRWQSMILVLLLLCTMSLEVAAQTDAAEQFVTLESWTEAAGLIEEPDATESMADEAAVDDVMVDTNTSSRQVPPPPVADEVFESAEDLTPLRNAYRGEIKFRVDGIDSPMAYKFIGMTGIRIILLTRANVVIWRTALKQA